MGLGRRARKLQWKRSGVCSVLGSSSVSSENKSVFLETIWSHIPLTSFQVLKVFNFWFGFQKCYQIMKGQAWRAFREGLGQGSNW